MKIFELMKKHDQEQIAFYSDKPAKLRAILSIHSTALGPAIGGIRIYKYKSISDALFDLCRLSKTMTYKAAASGLNFGGGYIVLIEQEGMERSEPLFRSLGRFIESFKGRFIAGGEMGVTEESMEYIGMETQYLTGLPAYFGGSGDHSYMGALGTFRGIQAAAHYKWGSDNLENRKIIIQGFGRTGAQLADFLKKNKANVIVTDVIEEKLQMAQKKGFETIQADSLYNEPCDILAPCAIGSIISQDTVDKFKCQIIAGAANNQLLNENDDLLLKKRGILFAPDFIINAGGIIDVADEYGGYKRERVMRKTECIYDRVLEILKFADQNDISNTQSAIQYAQNRIEAIKKIQSKSLRK
jgi:leucine dehydrogenase